MAAVSSHAAKTTSSNGPSGLWEFAVPVTNDQASAYSDSKPSMPDATSKSASRQPFPTPVNGTHPKAVRTNTQDSQGSINYQSQDADPFTPQRGPKLARKQSNLGGNGGQPDGLVDLYKQHVDNRNGQPAMGNGEKRKFTGPDNWKGKGKTKDDSAWIHRDKLAQIESRELEEAGFRVRAMSRSSSSAQMRDRSLDGRPSEEHLQQRVPKEEKRPRAVSPILAEPEEAVEDDDGERFNWDLRTPEEVAADHEISHTRSSSARPSCRIPVSKSSPLPLPYEVVERDSPLPRSRHGSGNLAGSIQEAGIAFSKARARSASVGSQALLDDQDHEVIYSDEPIEQFADDPSPKGSPSKARSPTKATSKKGQSRSGSQSKPRQGSGQTAKRPGTSGGISRPSTSHRPEGEAPWIATMYKPDPKLPPDQQIIPTHARKIAREQWEKEGKTGSMYDREFRLLNAEEFAKPATKDRDSQKVEKEKDEEEQWPLRLPSPRTDRPSTNGTEHGGYRTMPTISNSKLAPGPQSPSPGPQAHARTPKPEDVIRIQDPPEAPKQKKGCCCIVM